MAIRHLLISLMIVSISLISCNKSNNTNSPNEKFSTLQLLQGKWQSIDDKTNYLIFEKNHRKEIAEGMNQWKNEEFVLSNKCSNYSDIDNSINAQGDKYITTKNQICVGIL